MLDDPREGKNRKLKETVHRNAPFHEVLLA
jgi:hypothetical protein